MKCLQRFALAAAAALICCQSAQADLSSYSQDFEGLDQTSPTALTDDGWLGFANVFNPAGDFLYNYGPFGAPNGGPGFSGITVGEGSASGAQGSQHMVTYSDYNNGDHGNGNIIEANVFQEQIVGAADVGQTYTFSFDANNRDLAAPSTALAFIKTLDPANGFALTNFVTQDTSSLTDWTSFSLDITIDGGLNGQILQFGFLNTATNFDNSGVNYDNVSFSAVPEPGTMGVLALGLVGLVSRRRRS